MFVVVVRCSWLVVALGCSLLSDGCCRSVFVVCCRLVVVAIRLLFDFLLFGVCCLLLFGVL